MIKRTLGFIPKYAAALAIVTLGANFAHAGDPDPIGAPNAPAQVPVREVVLFSSGVGYFEHFGTIHGDAATELRFKTEQINDILKSLLLEDLDGGKITSVTYGSQAPISHTLQSFEIDITTNPPLAALLNQLRGRSVTATLIDGQMTGTVLGVEKRQRSAGKDSAPIDVWVLNLLSGGSIRPVELDHVNQLKLDDPRLQEELNKALAALAQSRERDKKPVVIHFRGKGDHRVRVGYVVEAPVWKTSYRLVMPADDAHAEAKDVGPQTKPADGAAPATQPGAGATEGRLQGWAIVENQTDSDWNDVQLSLVSGRPLSFIEDLYQPLFVPRPIVQPQLYASLRPQTYDAGMADRNEAMSNSRRTPRRIGRVTR